MTPVPDRSTFGAMYAGQAPWGISKPQKPFIDVADQITGTARDSYEDRRITALLRS